MFLADLLETMGHEVCASVASGAAAVAAAARCVPDLMIIDGNLEEEGGVSAVASILRTRFVPHIFATGDVYRLGADPGAIVMQKPYSLPDLERAIVRAMALAAPS
jgi:two-component system, response regulator PdtaR